MIPKGTDTQICFHWEPMISRYVVYLRARPNVRVIAMAESEDLLEWTEREVIVAPDELDPPQDNELYGMSSMAYREFRIGFLSVFHVLYESWSAVNPTAAAELTIDGPDEWMNTMDIQLVYSGDGRSYHRAGNREPILRVGQPGTP